MDTWNRKKRDRKIFFRNVDRVSLQNGPTCISVRARNAHQVVVGSDDTFSLVGSWLRGDFIDQDTRISKRFSSRGNSTPSKQLSLSASYANAFTVLLFFLPLSPFSLSPFFSRSFQYCFQALLLPFLSVSAKYLVTAATEIRREQKRRCHILAYERS